MSIFSLMFITAELAMNMKKNKKEENEDNNRGIKIVTMNAMIIFGMIATFQWVALDTPGAGMMTVLVFAFTLFFAGAFIFMDLMDPEASRLPREVVISQVGKGLMFWIIVIISVAII